MSKKLISLVLSFCLMLSCLTAASFASAAAASESTNQAVATAEYDNPAKDIQSGTILQLWDWSFNNIKYNMKKIADQGFTAIQTSPIQTIKESTLNRPNSGNWWVYYQPSNFNIETSYQNALGTKTEFQQMVDVAHSYGVKVIVDAVLNHMANKNGNDLSDTIPADLRNDSSCWHSITTNTTNWSDRYDVTHYCLDGLPDLNTGNSKVQNYAIGFLKECIDCGVDGFRFDNAKGIETPDDRYGVSSDFWPNVLNATTSYAQSTQGKTPYYYGEILDDTGGVSISAYTKYMSVTENQTSNDIRNCVNSGNAGGAATSYFRKGCDGKYLVMWNESHDTYADGSSSGVGASAMNKTWALVASRNAPSAMYMARPSNNSQSIGTGSLSAWTNNEVKAVNQFKDYFAGQSEYLAYSGSIAYNERGTGGVVLVNCSGTSTSVNVPAHKMQSGTYTDAVTGKEFKVSNGVISGNIGDTGIAVVYNRVNIPEAFVTPGSKTFNTDTLALTLGYKNATKGYYSFDKKTYMEYTNGKVITIGADVPYESTINVYVQATDGTTTSQPILYTYKKTNKSQAVYFDNSSYNWSSVYAYIYVNSSLSNAAWPGVKMNFDSNTGYYKLNVDSSLSNGLVIFSESADATTNRYPGNMEDGVALNGKTMILRANHQWVEYDEEVSTTQSTTSSQNYTVTFTNSCSWSGTIYCYYWKDGSTGPVAWPGKSMTYSTTNSYGQAVYTVEVPKTMNRLIFSNGSSQTVNIPFTGASLRYYAESTTDTNGHHLYGTW